MVRTLLVLAGMLSALTACDSFEPGNAVDSSIADAEPRGDADSFADASHDGGAVLDAEATDAGAVDASTGDASVSDATIPDASIEDAAVPAAPITAPNETWTWVPVEGMRCGNGSQNGVAVNLTDRSNDVYVVYEGGGGCWDWDTCFTAGVASRIWEDLSGPAIIDTALAYGGREESPNSFFRRDVEENPFRDASFVFVPYCTGDLHSGSGTTTYTRGSESRTVHYVGGDNQAILVPRLVATFPEAEHVWVTGYSAGGFGATLNWWRYIDAFEGSEVHALNDCGTPADSAPALWSTWKSSMHLTFPPGCDECEDGFSRLFPFYARTVPAPHRFGYMGYRGDVIIALYFGFLAPENASNGLAILAAAVEVSRHVDAAAAALAGGSLQHAYRLDGVEHVMSMQGGFETMLRTATAPRTFAMDWVRQWATGDAAWRSVGP